MIRSLTTPYQSKYSGSMQGTPVSKKILLGLLLVVLAIIGALFYAHRASNVVVAPVNENTPMPAAGDWPSTKVSEANITDNKSYYTISAVYPVTRDAVITGYFKTFVEQAIAQFKDDTSWAATDASTAPAEAAALTLNITYTEQKGTYADNYIFSTTTYTGGAHGLASTKTFSFSSTGQLVSLSSLFTNGLNGLKTVAPYVKSQLASTLPAGDQSFIDSGTEATQDNYQSFVVSDDGVLFMFDPYQVAPYSDGQQSVKVPLTVFRSIASPDIFPTR